MSADVHISGRKAMKLWVMSWVQETAGNLSSLLQAASAGPRASAETMAHIGPVAAAALPPPAPETSDNVTASGSSDLKPSEEAATASAAPLDGGKLQPLADQHVLSR
jgi:hypothetical protein